ncbi:MAG: hypothetical protein ACQESR_06010 [Planctomycetota bacterium]
MEICSMQAVLPLVGLAAENVIRDRYARFSPWVAPRTVFPSRSPRRGRGGPVPRDTRVPA